MTYGIYAGKRYPEEYVILVEADELNGAGYARGILVQRPYEGDEADTSDEAEALADALNVPIAFKEPDGGLLFVQVGKLGGLSIKSDDLFMPFVSAAA